MREGFGRAYGRARPEGGSVYRLYLIASVVVMVALAGFARPSEARTLHHSNHRHHAESARMAAHHRASARSERPAPARDSRHDRTHHRATMPRVTHNSGTHRNSTKHGARHVAAVPSHDSRQQDAGTRIGLQSTIQVRSQEAQVISGRGPPSHPLHSSIPHPAIIATNSPANISQQEPPAAAGPSRDLTHFASQGASAQVEAGARVHSLDRFLETGQPTNVRPLPDRLKGAAGRSIVPFAGGNP